MKQTEKRKHRRSLGLNATTIAINGLNIAGPLGIEGISKTCARKRVDGIFDAIVTAPTSSISGVGKFQIKKNAAR